MQARAVSGATVAAGNRTKWTSGAFLRWSRTSEGMWFLALLGVALLFRLLIAPFVHMTGDLEAYGYWGDLVRNHFLDTYSYGHSTGDWSLYPIYPPLAMYVFGVVEAIYLGVVQLLGLPASSAVPATHQLDLTMRLVLKLPTILSDTATISILYALARRLLAPAVALFAVATYAFMPGVLIDGLLWGQTEGIALLLALVGLLFALNRKGLWAGLLFGLAVGFKIQSAIFLPLGLFYLARWAGWKEAARSIGILVGTTTLLWLPYLLHPQRELVAWAQNFSAIVGLFYGISSHGAYDTFNFWWLIGMAHVSGSTRIVGPMTLTKLAFALYAGFAIVVLAGIWRNRSAGQFWAGAALLSLGFFDLGPLQFERYLFSAIGLFFLAALYDRRYWVAYAVASLTLFTNMLNSMNNCGCAELPFPVPSSVFSVLRLDLHGQLEALLNVGVLVFGLYLYLRSAGKKPAPQLATDTILGAAVATPVVARSGGGGNADGLRVRNVTREPYVSVVIPCYNEEGNIQAMHERLIRAIAPLTSTYELIFVNNGSYDGSAALFDALAATDPHVTVLTLSRNFGSQGAYTSGMEYASGDCVICLDGDIQDPPELIPTFIEKWREGYDVVYGVRVRRKGSILRRIGYKAFYRLLHKVSYIQVPIDAGDFGLMDRRVVDAVNAMPERSRLIRGLRAWVGFHQVGVPYTRDERFSGRTTNSIRGLFRWASLGIISFSFAPLDLISYLAAFVVGLSAVALVVYTALYFIVPDAPRGFETLLVVTLFLGAVQLLCLSIIGTYLARMFEEIKARPKYLIQDVQNDHRVQQTSTIQRHVSAGMAADGSGAIEHPPVATVSTTAARAPLD